MQPARDIAWVIAALSLAVAVAGCGHDTTHGALTDADADVTDADDTAAPPDGDDADAPDSADAPGDTRADADADAVPSDIVIPPGTLLASGVLLPPDASSPAGWRVANRFGVFPVTDPDGAFSVPVAADGLTVTVGIPPGAKAGDTTLLLAVTARLPELDGAVAPPLRLDAAGTASALVAAHPALAADDPWYTRRVLEAAGAHRAVATLAARITAAWPAGGRLVAHADVAHALDAAATLVARELTSAWPDGGAAVAPYDDGALTVRPLDDTPAGTATLTADGALAFAVPARLPLAAIVTVAPVAPEGAHARVPDDGDAVPLALSHPADLLALHDTKDSHAYIEITDSVLHRIIIPTGSLTLPAAAASAAVALSEAPVPIAAEGVWLARFVTGALAGPEAVRAWQDVPDDAWTALRVNLLAEALRVARWVAPDAGPGCASALLAPDPVARDALRADVLAGTPGPRFAALLRALVAATEPACLPADDPAAPWIAPLVAAALDAAPAPVAGGLAPSPASALSPLRHGADGHATGRLLLVRGAPLAPRLDAVAGVAAADTAVTPPQLASGAVVPLTGARLAGARAELSDAGGHLRAAPVVVDADGTASFTLPPGLAGAVTLTLAGPGGRGTPVAVAIAPRLDRLDPAFVYRGPDPVVIRAEGDGLAPGQVLHLGLLAIPVPDDAAPDGFTVTLAPADLVPGALPVTLSPSAGAPGQASAAPLFAADAPVVVGAAPSPLYPGQTLRLTGLRVGLAPEDVHVTLDDGVMTWIAPVRAIVPDAAGGVLVTAAGPAFTGSGLGVVTVTTPAGSGALTVALAQPPTRLQRTIRFHSDIPALRAVRLLEAFGAANGTHQPEGEFWRADSGYVDGGQPWCPLDIRPAMFSIPPPSCAHPSGVCDDGWAWADTADPSSWIDVTFPPGHLASGSCAPVAGLASWQALSGPDQVFDTVTTPDPLPLGDAPTLYGPGVRLTLPDARGGGLVIGAAAGGTRNDVVLDLVVHAATGAAVTLDGANGVRIARLEVVGTPGACDAGLVITHARDVRIDTLDVSGCATGLVVIDSEDVRTTVPATLFGNVTGATITRSTDVSLAARVGWRSQQSAPGYAIAVGQTDGVVIEDSDRVWLDLPVAVALADDAARIVASRDVRVSTNAGFLTQSSGALIAPGTAVDVGVRLADDVTRGRVVDSVIMNARDGIVLGAVQDVLVARCELGVRSRLGAADALPPGNRGAGIRIAPSKGIEGVVLRDLTLGRNAEAGVRIELAAGDIRLERLSSEVVRDDGAVVPGAQPCFVSAVYTEGLRASELLSRGDISGLCLAGDEDVIVTGLVVQDAMTDGVFVTQSSQVVLRDVVIAAPGGAGARLQTVGSVALDDALIADPVGPGVRVTGDLGVAAQVELTRLSVLAPGGDGVNVATTGGLVWMSGLEVIDPTTTGVRATGGDLRIDGGRLAPSDGASSPEDAVGVDVSASARVHADDLVIADLGDDGVRATGRADVRLGPGVVVSGSGGVGVSVTGAARVVVAGAHVTDNAREGIRADELAPGARLVLRDASVGASGGGRALRVTDCGGDDGVIDVAGGALGPVAITRCDHRIRLDGAQINGDLTLDRDAASRLGRLTVDGTVTVTGGGDHRLDAVSAAGGVHLAAAMSGGLHLANVPGASVIADDAVSAAHVPPTRIGERHPSPAGEALELVSAPHADLALSWVAAGEATPVAHLRAGADGGALGRGLVPLVSNGAWQAIATLPDGSTGTSAAADAACRLPAAAPNNAAPGLAWLDGGGAVGGDAPDLPGALSATSCGATLAWGAAPSGHVGDIWLLDVASGDVTQLTDGDGDDDREPTLAPDCGAVAWVVGGAGSSDLALMPLPGGARVGVTADAAVERTPLLTPGALYYARRAPGEADFVLVRRDRADLAAPAEVIFDGAGDDLWPTATPDGRWLAWARCPAGESAPCGLAVMGPTGGATALSEPDGPCDDRRPAFWVAPDGTPTLAALRRAVADSGALGAPRLVTLTRFGRATWTLTTSVGPAAQPFCCVAAP